MRASEKGMHSQSADARLFGLDFHDFIQREKETGTFELASEFGLTVKDVKKLKKHMERS